MGRKFRIEIGTTDGTPAVTIIVSKADVASWLAALNSLATGEPSPQVSTNIEASTPHENASSDSAILSPILTNPTPPVPRSFGEFKIQREKASMKLQALARGKKARKEVALKKESGNLVNSKGAASINKSRPKLPAKAKGSTVSVSAKAKQGKPTLPRPAGKVSKPDAPWRQNSTRGYSLPRGRSAPLISSSGSASPRSRSSGPASRSNDKQKNDTLFRPKVDKIAQGSSSDKKHVKKRSASEGRPDRKMTPTEFALANANGEFQKRQAKARKQQEDNFRKIDADGGGTLDLDEIVKGAHILDITEEVARELFAELDDGSGEVSIETFLAKTKGRTQTKSFGRAASATESSLNAERSMTQGEEMIKNRTGGRAQQSMLLDSAKEEFQKRQAKARKQQEDNFRKIDADGGGTLDLDEIVKGAHILHITEEVARELFAELDDGSGEVSIETFLAKTKGRTQTKSFGRAASATESSLNAERSMTQGEEMIKNRVGGRAQHSMLLDSAKEEFQKRQAKARKQHEDNFRKIDADGGGTLDLDEIVKGAHILDISEEVARELFAELDDGSGEVSVETFLAKTKGRTQTKSFGRAASATKSSAMKKTSTQGESMYNNKVRGRKVQSDIAAQAREDFDKRTASNRKRAEAKFRELDADNSGTLDLDELLTGAHLLGLSEDDARALFQELDANLTGEVGVDEFLAKAGSKTTTKGFGRAAQATLSSMASQKVMAPFDAAATAAAIDAARSASEGRAPDETWSELLNLIKAHGLADTPAQALLMRLGYTSIPVVAVGDELALRKGGMTRMRAIKLKSLCQAAVREAEEAAAFGEKQIPTLETVRGEFEKRAKKMRKEAEARFRALDTDGGGTLDLQELLNGAHLLGLTEDDATFLFHEIDKDGGGEIEIDEFLAKCGRSTTTAKLGRFAEDTESSAATRVKRQQPSVLASRAMAAAQANMAAAAEQFKVHRPEDSDKQTADWIAKYSTPKGKNAAHGKMPVMKRPAPTQRMVVEMELPVGALADEKARRKFVDGTALRLGVPPNSVVMKNVGSGPQQNPLVSSDGAESQSGTRSGGTTTPATGSASSSRASTPARGRLPRGNESGDDNSVSMSPHRNKLSKKSSSKSSSFSFKIPSFFSGKKESNTSAAEANSANENHDVVLSSDYNHYTADLDMGPKNKRVAARPNLTSSKKATKAGVGRGI
jgi:Ca2+-binding EF-hand superfamily protein